MKAKVFPQRILFSVLIAALSISAFGQTSTQVAPSVDRLRTHITYLASDALEGRRTGTPGAQGAAQYIAGEFSNLGLRPGMQPARTARSRGEAKSRYLQQFPYVAGVQLGKNNVLRLVPVSPGPSTGDTKASTIEFRVGEEWAPLGLSSQAGIVDAPLAFVNYGITASELKYDDYAGKTITGHIAVAFAGTPDGDNPHGRFARYEDVRWKAIAARNAGAKALLVIAREPNFKDDPLSRLRYDNRAGDAGLPVAAISRQAAERMMQISGVLGSLWELETLLRQVISNALTSGESDKSLEPKLLGAVKVSLATDILRREVAASNVIGILVGSDPVLKNEAIVIGAHYDHLGRGGAGSLAPRQGDVHHGADDNASGVAGILELARTFTEQRPKPRRTMVFIAFGGEEEGLLGSNYYVNHPVVPITNTVAMINLDMIGRLKNKNLVIGGVGTAPEWRSMIESANLGQTLSVNARATASTSPASANHIPLVVGANGGTVVSSDSSKMFQLTLNEDGFGPSDHSSFYAKQIPVLFFWTGTHEDYHKPSDTADKINYQDEARILSLVGRIVRDVDANHKRPTYTVAKSASTGRSSGFRVYLGTIPNYADSNDGLLLDGVREGSPAAAAGLQAGDRIVKLAGREVRNVYDYTYALGEMKAGQEYEVEILRGTERLKLKLIPAARK